MNIHDLLYYNEENSETEMFWKAGDWPGEENRVQNAEYLFQI